MGALEGTYGCISTSQCSRMDLMLEKPHPKGMKRTLVAMDQALLIKNWRSSDVQEHSRGQDMQIHFWRNLFFDTVFYQK